MSEAIDRMLAEARLTARGEHVKATVGGVRTVAGVYRENLYMDSGIGKMSCFCRHEHEWLPAFRLNTRRLLDA